MKKGLYWEALFLISPWASVYFIEWWRDGQVWKALSISQGSKVQVTLLLWNNMLWKTVLLLNPQQQFFWILTLKWRVTELKRMLLKRWGENLPSSTIVRIFNYLETSCCQSTSVPLFKSGKLLYILLNGLIELEIPGCQRSFSEWDNILMIKTQSDLTTPCHHQLKSAIF